MGLMMAVKVVVTGVAVSVAQYWGCGIGDAVSVVRLWCWQRGDGGGRANGGNCCVCSLSDVGA